MKLNSILENVTEFPDRGHALRTKARDLGDDWKYDEKYLAVNDFVKIHLAGNRFVFAQAVRHNDDGWHFMKLNKSGVRKGTGWHSRDHYLIHHPDVERQVEKIDGPPSREEIVQNIDHKK